MLLAAMTGFLTHTMHAQAPAQPLPEMDISLPCPPAQIDRHKWTEGVNIALRSGGAEALEISATSVRGRGNSTWAKNKKPYKLRLAEPLSLLGMPAHREWALLANVMDHSHLRNHLALEIARRTSLGWTPRGNFVRVRLNGEDSGLYYLSELVGIAPSRLHPDYCAVLLEFDTHRGGNVEATLPDGTHPKEWRAVARPRSLQLDTLSLVDWMIVNELAMNAEVHGPRSCFMHITPEGVLRAGPVWDYDLAFNALGVDAGGDLRPLRLKGGKDGVRWLDADSLYCLDAGLVEKLSAEGFPMPSRDELLTLMRLRWRGLRDRFYQLESELDALAAAIRRDAEDDQRQWNSADPARFDPSDSFAVSLSRLKKTFDRRLAFMDKLLTE